MFRRFFKWLSRGSETGQGAGSDKAVPSERAEPIEWGERAEALAHGRIVRSVKYAVGDVLRHRIHPFRGVVFDIDPEFSNTEEWYEAIPEDVRPHRDQPYYHLFAESDSSHYVAYVSEQNLEHDDSLEPLSHPDIMDVFDRLETGYALKGNRSN